MHHSVVLQKQRCRPASEPLRPDTADMSVTSGAALNAVLVAATVAATESGGACIALCAARRADTSAPSASRGCGVTSASRGPSKKHALSSPAVAITQGPSGLSLGGADLSD